MSLLKDETYFLKFQAMKAFIETNFKMMDLNGDGVITKDEFRYNCITRIAIEDIEPVDEAFDNLLSVRKLFVESG